jgi:hypothetical protein
MAEDPKVWPNAGSHFCTACKCCSENSSSSNAATLQLNVELGMSQSQVLAIMGEPQRRETHGGTEFLLYATEEGDKTALLHFIPIAIVDGRVTGLGRHVYDHVVQSKAKSDLEPSKPSPAGDPRR